MRRDREAVAVRGGLKIESAGWAKAHLRRATKIVQN
jgi:hypothetical protein